MSGSLNKEEGRTIMKKIMWAVLGMWVLVSGWLVGPVGAMAQELAPVSQQEQQALLETTVMPFLKALQTGDVQRLEQLIGGKLALTLGKLLRENTEYPNYLRQRYGGTTVRGPIQIESRQEETGGVHVAELVGARLAVVQLETPSGGQDQFLLNLEQDAQGVWKIVDKIRHR